MIDSHALWLFIFSGLLLNITPGPDMLYVMGRAASQGARAGLVAALGIGAGCFVHIIAGALGFSAVLAASATAFLVLKIVGACYLAYVGISLLMWRPSPAASQPMIPASLTKTFMQGVLTNALNPKVALFFLAFVPQFIEPTAAHKELTFLVLGAIFNFTGTLWNCAVAWMSAKLGTRMRNGRVVMWLNRSIGAVFVALGVRLALAGPQNS
jgi:threonine/homoserine/homoserine lactone efflux protein